MVSTRISKLCEGIWSIQSRRLSFYSSNFFCPYPQLQNGQSDLCVWGGWLGAPLQGEQFFNLLLAFFGGLLGSQKSVNPTYTLGSLFWSCQLVPTNKRLAFAPTLAAGNILGARRCPNMRALSIRARADIRAQEIRHYARVSTILLQPQLWSCEFYQ